MKMPNRKILVDADVVSHFIKGNEAYNLKIIFPNNELIVLDKVQVELMNWKDEKFKLIFEGMISKSIVSIIDFPEENEDIKKEYFRIKSEELLGDGESACLSVARFDKSILSSSNLKDINKYCVEYNIDYLSTMDILCYALKEEIFTLERCNAFLARVKSKKSVLPVQDMGNYTCRKIDFL